MRRRRALALKDGPPQHMRKPPARADAFDTLLNRADAALKSATDALHSPCGGLSRVPEAYDWLGRCLFHTGRVPEAKAALQNALTFSAAQHTAEATRQYLAACERHWLFGW
jgi:hypothetical protein